MNPTDRERLEQELWELRFGCHHDPAGLRERLAADPELRAVADAIEHQAAVLEEAARDPIPELDLDPRSLPARRWHAQSPVLRRIARTAAAAAILVAAATGWYGLQAWRAQAVQRIPEIVVSAPGAVAAGAPFGFTVELRDGRSRPIEAAVAWRAIDGAGTEVARGAADVAGTRRFEVGPTLPGTQRIVVDAAGIPGGTGLELVVDAAHAARLVHLSTDRPAYRPGEVVRARAVRLDRITLVPAAFDGAWQMRVRDPHGAIVTDTPVYPDRAADPSVLALAWIVPEVANGGRYRLELHGAQSQSGSDPDAPPIASTEFLVRRFERPQLQKDLTLARTTYAPGETVSATIAVVRLGSAEPAAGATADAMLTVDGSEVARQALTLDTDGSATIALRLPDRIERGAARLAVRVTDGGHVETAVRPFVVPTGVIVIEAFPEGGDLVAGFGNRVYFECADPLGRPVDARGRLVDDRGETIATIASSAHGRGLVEFTPDPARRYALVADTPSSARAELPPPSVDAILLQSLATPQPAGAPLRVRIATGRDARLVVAAFCRNTMVGQITTSGSGARDVEIPIVATASGVLRVTVFDTQLMPRAERLVQRMPSAPLQIALAPGHVELAPRASQTIAVTTRRADGTPVSAIVGLVVADAANHAFAEDPQIGIADALALFADMPEFDDSAAFDARADYLLASPDAATATDLLLGTRGWRRFGWRSPAHDADPVRRAVLARGGLDDRPRVISSTPARVAIVAQRERSVAAAEQFFAAMLGLGLLMLIGHLLLEIGARAGRLVLPRISTLSPDFGAGVGGAAAATALLALFSVAALLPNGGLPGAILRDELFKLEEFASADGNLRGMRPPSDSGTVDRSVLALESEDELGGYRFDLDVRRRAAITGTELLGLLRQQTAGDDADEEDKSGLIATGGGGRGSLRVYSREFAHARATGAARADFAETIYWNPLLVTDATGHASVSFDVADQITTWRVRADAHGAGSVGQAQTEFVAKLPFRIEARVPVELSIGDRVSVPLALESNAGDAARAGLAAVVRGGLRLDSAPSQDIVLDGGRGRAFVDVSVTAEGDAELEVKAAIAGFQDHVRREVRVVPRGFPHRRSFAGVLPEQPTIELTVPAGLPTAPRAELSLYPSTLSTLRAGLDGMLQEPHGCFEQTSSTNYPNVLTLAYLRATGGVAPAVEARARSYLETGYARLVGYECAHQGFEWFGADPGHTALTAYGVLQFSDMADVFVVDDSMVARTRGWLLEKRTGDGTYRPDARRFGFGGAPSATTAAYSTYALLGAGLAADDLKAELDRLERRAATTPDAYELALAACAFGRTTRDAIARDARARLVTMQGDDGGIDGATTSITQSGGDDLRVEATGFAVLAWLDDPSLAGHAARGVDYLLSRRDGRGAFGATQATICALRALVAWARHTPQLDFAGTVRVRVDGRELHQIAFRSTQPDPVRIDLGDAITPGRHRVELAQDGAGSLPWACDLSYHAETPADDPNAALTIRTGLDRSTAVEGETVTVRVTVANRNARELPMTIAIVGLPAGLELPAAVLDDRRRAGLIDAWETRGREVVIYWRGMAPEQRRDLDLDCVAAVPGTTIGPASRTYPYYDPSAIRWAEPLQIEIAPAR